MLSLLFLTNLILVFYTPLYQTLEKQLSGYFIITCMPQCFINTGNDTNNAYSGTDEYISVPKEASFRKKTRRQEESTSPEDMCHHKLINIKFMVLGVYSCAQFPP